MLIHFTTKTNQPLALITLIKKIIVQNCIDAQLKQYNIIRTEDIITNFK